MRKWVDTGLRFAGGGRCADTRIQRYIQVGGLVWVINHIFQDEQERTGGEKVLIQVVSKLIST